MAVRRSSGVAVPVDEADPCALAGPAPTSAPTRRSEATTRPGNFVLRAPTIAKRIRAFPSRRSNAGENGSEDDGEDDKL
jgi:hypothetical protein